MIPQSPSKVKRNRHFAGHRTPAPLLVEIDVLQARLDALHACAWASTFGGSYAWHRALNDLVYLPEAAERLAGLAEQYRTLAAVGREEVQS